MVKKADDFLQKVSSWSDLSQLVEHFSVFAGYDWLFRGVSQANYELVPKIGRVDIRAAKRNSSSQDSYRVPYRIEDERAVFRMFKQQSRAHLDFIPQTDLQWLSLAQHFGLPTRLLDWTDSLLVAAWFAVEKGGGNEKQSDSAIWVTRTVPSIEFDSSDDPLTLNFPMTYRPPHITPRITAQGSVFVVSSAPTKPLTLSFAKRVIIDRKAGFTIKKRLNACGINRRRLFPDLVGLCDHLAWMYKHDWLAGYRVSEPREANPRKGNNLEAD
jgi:hypothetical protein